MLRLWTLLLIVFALAGCAVPLKPPSHPAMVEGCQAYTAHVDEKTLQADPTSIREFILWGQDVRSQLQTGKCEWDTLFRRQEELQIVAQQSKVEGDQLSQDLTAWQQKSEALMQSVADFKSRCKGGVHLTKDQYLACAAQEMDLNTQMTAQNAAFPALKDRKTAFDAKANAHAEKSHALVTTFDAVKTDYPIANSRDDVWLIKALAFITTPSFRSKASTLGCPDMSKIPSDSEAKLTMTDAVLDCLSKAAAN